MENKSFETLLTGGHPNSLGNTELVVEMIMGNKANIDELFDCYSSEDEVVRLRTSSAFKRIGKAKPEWLQPYIDRFLSEITQLDQASAQWTLAILFDDLKTLMNEDQKKSAIDHMKKNLESHTDWIVINTTMQVLFEWSSDIPSLREWIIPHLHAFLNEKRKSISGRAKKLIAQI